MRKYLVAQILAHLVWLLHLDRVLAHKLFGAYWGLTLSGYAWHLECRGLFWGRMWSCKIDGIFLWLWNERDHCKGAFEKDLTAFPELRTHPKLKAAWEQAIGSERLLM